MKSEKDIEDIDLELKMTEEIGSLLDKTDEIFLKEEGISFKKLASITFIIEETI